jgi:arylsulfatase A
VREPGIFWWPGRIPAGKVTSELACTMDLFVTSLRLAGAEVPTDRPIDGVDLSPVLFGTGPNLRQSFVYYRDMTAWAIRKGPWKMHVTTRSSFGKDNPVNHDPPLLFNLAQDPSEKHNVAARNGALIAEMKKLLADHQATVTPVENQLEKDFPGK